MARGLRRPSRSARPASGAGAARQGGYPAGVRVVAGAGVGGLTEKRAAISLRLAKAADAPFILRMEETGMQGYAIALWGSWRPSATPDTLDPTGHRIVVWDRRDVGVVATERESAHVRLRKLYIATSFRNLGIGAQVLGSIVKEAAASARRPAQRPDHHPAIRFYLQGGFEIVDRDPKRIWMECRPAQPCHP